MKNTIKGGVAALGIAGAIAAATGTAHAETEGEINDHSGLAYALELNEDGIPGTSTQAASLASTICSDRAAGYGEKMLEQRAGAIEGSPSDGIIVVDGAEYHFCPGYEMKPDYVTPAWVQNPNWPGGWAPNDGRVPSAIPDPTGTLTAWAEPR
jgi:hypothetical protein